MKIVGWILIASSFLGLLFFLSYVGHWDFPQDSDLMGPKVSGGSSNAPIMLGLFAIAGAYLISRPDSESD